MNGIALVFSYIGRYWRLVTANAVVLLGASFLEGLGLGMIVPIVQSIEKKQDAGIFMKYASWLCGLFHLPLTFHSLLMIFSVIMLLGYAVTALQQYLSKLLQVRVTYDLRKEAFENLLALPAGYYHNKKIGDLIVTLHISAANSGSLFYYGMQFAVSVVLCFVYVYLNFLLSWQMMIIACAFALASYCFVLPRFRIGFAHGKETKEISDKFASFLLDRLSGNKTIKAFNNEALHQKELESIASDSRRMAINIQSNVIKAGLFTEPLLLMLLVILTFMAIEVFHIAIAGLIGFFYIFIRMVGKIKAANSDYLQIVELMPHFSKIEELLRRDDKVYINDGQLNFYNFNREIRFDHVYFRYGSSDDYLLKDISFTLEKGMNLAIVGSSGAGKTTLIGLIMRFYEPERGRITIDGIGLSEMRNRDLRKLISIVEQEPYLFHDTIYNNILYGKPDAKKEEVIRASRLAHAEDFIMESADKYETIVGERGARLSGGQKQRIALARALIRNPQILILDEATSALDSESEQQIKKSIQELSRRLTIIMIAHRISTISSADKLIVIEEGRVVEQGSQEDLLNKKGVYEKYHRLQYNT